MAAAAAAAVVVVGAGATASNPNFQRVSESKRTSEPKSAFFALLVVLLCMSGSVSLWFHPAFVLFFLGVLASVWVGRRFRLRRALQVFSMTLFVGLLWLASFAGRPEWPVDFFLISDPLIALIASTAGRVFFDPLLVSLFFVALAIGMGRLFCSHVCPLGTLLDLSDQVFSKKLSAKSNPGFRRARKAKFFLLLLLCGAAVMGFNFLGFLDPIALMTRFTATVFYPVTLVVGEAGLSVLRPLGAKMGWIDLAYLELSVPVFAGAFFTALIVLLLLLLSRLAPRFWCRTLCPLGAMFGWLGRFAWYRRRVKDECTGCNRCTLDCPTGAIFDKGKTNDRSECIVCLHCVQVCPEKAVRFGWFKRKDPVFENAGPLPGRREFLGGLVSGLAAGALLSRVPRSDPLIRPPGSLPESEFLSRCIRCGECLKACTTNTLQPDWHRAGLEGLWAPRLDLRHAFCEQRCTVCGQVCPTGAIRPLRLEEKRHAKIGTAVVLKDSCIAWGQDRKCLICRDECPYGAIAAVNDTVHRTGLPAVNADKCNGCGHCENQCPVTGDSAIVVVPHGEVRLSSGSYVEEAKALGLTFLERG
jgi:MauM/NapG family ferredoxin protein